MRLRLVLAAMALPLFVACAGDEQPATEPVATEGGIPDAPGGDELGAPAETAEPSGDATASDTDEPAGDAMAEAPAAATGGDSMTVTTDLNVRSGPGTRNSVVRVIKRGETVNVSNCQANWCQIGQGEYVSKKYLR